MANLHKMEVLHALPKEAIGERMRANMLEFDVPRFKCKHTISICGYGPSLKDTWQEIDRNFQIVTTSGAHDFLIERGIIPDYHVECDPRIHKLEFLRKPNKRTIYLISSICHPEMFRMLEGYKVVMWHPVTDAFEEQRNIIRELEIGGHIISGGSNAGMRAQILFFYDGYRNFHLFGIDCSYKNGETWAGVHSGQPHAMNEVISNNKRFWTSDVMYNAAQEFVEMLASPFLHGCRFYVHGDGLLAERILLGSEDINKAVHQWVKVA